MIPAPMVLEPLVDLPTVVEDLRAHGYALLPVRRTANAGQSSWTAPLYRALSQPDQDCDTQHLRGSLKTQPGLKRRLQLRRRHPGDMAAAEEPLEQSFAALEGLLHECFAAVCAAAGLPHARVMARLFPAAAGRSKTVCNALQYLDGGDHAEPWCRAHGDPGLITVLARSDLAALQLCLRAPAGATDADTAWVEVEPLMDERAAALDSAGAGAGGAEVLLLLSGMTLERLTEGAFPACVHRVPRSPAPGATRLTVACELRPTVDMWHSWSTAEQGPDGQEPAGGG